MCVCVYVCVCVCVCVGGCNLARSSRCSQPLSSSESPGCITVVVLTGVVQQAAVYCRLCFHREDGMVDSYKFSPSSHQIHYIHIT